MACAAHLSPHVVQVYYGAAPSSWGAASVKEGVLGKEGQFQYNLCKNEGEADMFCLCNAALRIKWRDALELDPSRAHNQLCLINDFRDVPGAPDHGNVLWLEIEDR